MRFDQTEGTVVGVLVAVSVFLLHVDVLANFGHLFLRDLVGEWRFDVFNRDLAFLNASTAGVHDLVHLITSGIELGIESSASCLLAKRNIVFAVCNMTLAHHDVLVILESASVVVGSGGIPVFSQIDVVVR